MTDEEKLRYPIGRYRRELPLTGERREACIRAIEILPEELEDAVRALSQSDLDLPYRPGGWTVRQVVHHLADSHLNAYTRLKLALTEESPTIKPYDEARWAELPDSTGMPLDVSLDLIRGLHARWAYLLRSLSEDDFQRIVHHPEHQRVMSMDDLLGIYAWHGRHHIAHIQQAVMSGQSESR